MASKKSRSYENLILIGVISVNSFFLLWANKLSASEMFACPELFDDQSSDWFSYVPYL